ncbi:MAG: ATP-binding cassette domain-containing protein [Oceanipulchritudo sp.]
MQTDSLLETKGLRKSFPGLRHEALQPLRATLESGRMLGLIGPDGAGKTTLLRLLAGLLTPDDGEIRIAGLDPLGEAAKVREIIGYMPQKFGLYEELTVMENLDLNADLRGITGGERKKRFGQLLTFTGLGDFTARRAGALSGGMKQKLGLACALLGRPRLLLLDEPSVGVDPISRRELWKMVGNLMNEGIGVIWSTSYLDEAAKCDRVLLLNKGQVLFQGPPENLRARSGSRSFEDAFIELMGGAPKGPSVLAENTPRKSHGKSVVVVEARDLTKRFGGFTATKEINFTIPSGEIFGLLGPNGAGKSTTFKMMCGLLKPTAGEALVTGISLSRAPGAARQRVGYMAQKFSLYGNLTTRQNLDFFSGVYGLRGRHRREQVRLMIDLFGLEGYLGRSSKDLPLGIKQRLALSCSLMHRPDILFLDEPTSGVDPVTRREFWTHIKGLAQKGVTVMVTTHFMDEAENCDRIGLMYQAELIALGSPRELKKQSIGEKLERPSLEDAFIELIKRRTGGEAAA